MSDGEGVRKYVILGGGVREDYEFIVGMADI